MNKFAQLKIDDQLYDLPIYQSSIGHPVIDVTKLYGQAGYCTFDPGFMSTASCKSRITYIDGDAGILRYRGYDIKDLAEKSDFMSVSYLLINGELPNDSEKQAFIDDIKNHSLVSEQLRILIAGFRHSAHPMAIMMGAIGCLSAVYYDCIDNKKDKYRDVIRTIAKIPTIAAMAYKYSIGQPFMYPNNSLGFIENFLYMMFSTPCDKYIPDPVIVSALEKIFILHADHEQNASTSTLRVVASAGPNLFACINAATAALWGPAHGGANEAVINMLKEIDSADNIPQYIARAKNKDDPFKLMGFGHRVYKNYDPRASILKETCDQVLSKLNKKDNSLLIAKELERIALSDEYFIQRKLYPNVDFYSGIIYQAIGIPPQMFTVLFAVARVVGWVAHWLEMQNDGDFKIARPRQLYLGNASRDFK